MWPFNRFPYTDFNDVNLDWIMRALKEKISALVTSVNGKTGDVILTAADVGAMPADAPMLVHSVNGQTGAVVLDAEDVGAMPDDYVAPVTSVNGQTGAVTIPAAPVQSVNGQTGTVTLTASDVGAMPADAPTPVQSVNGQTGAVTLTAEDVGAMPSGYSPPVTSVNGMTGAVTVPTGGYSAATVVNASGVNAKVWYNQWSILMRINGAATVVAGTTLFTIQTLEIRPQAAIITTATLLVGGQLWTVRLVLGTDGTVKIYDVGDTAVSVTLNSDVLIVR